MARPPLARTARRRLAVALAFAWLSGWVTALVHVVHEEHVYCGEHRQFEELDDGRGADGLDPHDHGAEARTREEDGARGHERCDVLESTPAQEAPSTRLAATRLVAPPTPTTVATTERAHVVPLYRLAPKASPPRAI